MPAKSNHVSVGARLRVSNAADFGLTDSQLKVASALFIHCDQTSGQCSISDAVLADNSRVSPREIRRIMLKLQDADFIAQQIDNVANDDYHLVANVNLVRGYLERIRQRKPL